MSTWRKLISSAMEKYGETWDDVEHAVFDVSRVLRDLKYTVPDPDEVVDRVPDPTDIDACLDYQFHSGLGEVEGPEFTLWTKNRVYFPVCYDGAEWAASVQRNPCDEATRHVGGG